MTAQLGYQALADLIAARKWWFSASEVQGILTALAACKQSACWPEILFAAGEVDDIARQTFDHLGAQIGKTLNGASLDYQLLLPEDGNLAARAEALAAWAQGFGIAIHWLHPPLDNDSTAFLTDLEEIGKLDCRLEDREDNHRQLISLEEHCRMGALLIHAACHRGNK